MSVRRHKQPWTAMLLVALLLGFPVAVPAAITWTLEPTSPSVTAGQRLEVVLLISGKIPNAHPSIGAFDFDISFDPAILSPRDVSFGAFLGAPDTDALVDFRFLPGVVDIAAVSLLPADALALLQPEHFSLATLSFFALETGWTSLVFTQEIVDDAFGNKISPISEPGSAILVGLGLFPLAIYRRGRTRA